MGGISIVGGGEDVTMEEEIDRGDRVGNIELLGDRVCLENQGSASAGRGQVVHPGVATLEGRVSGEEVQEVKVVVDVKDGELMLVDRWFCEWEERTKGRRRRDRVSYSLPGQTLRVSTPARLSRSPLWLSISFIRSRTFVPLENLGGIESS